MANSFENRRFFCEVLKNLQFFEGKSELECSGFARGNHDESSMMVQGVGLACHGLDGDAHAVGGSVHLDCIVLLHAGLLPDIQGAPGAAYGYVGNLFVGGLGVCKIRSQAETVIDELVTNLSATHEAGVFPEVACGQVCGIENRQVGRRKGHDQVVHFFAQAEIGVPAFGIGHGHRTDVFHSGFDSDGFAGKGHLVGGAIGEGETGECARPVAGEGGGALFGVAFKILEFPFPILQKTVEGVGGPAYIVHQLVGFAIPGELCVCGTAGERCQAAACIGVGGNLMNGTAIAVAKQQIQEAVVCLACGV